MAEQYRLLFNLAVALPLVVLLAYFLLRYGLRWMAPSLGRGNLVVLKKIALDARSALYLVKTGPGAILIGVASGGMVYLKEFDSRELAQLLGDEDEGRTGAEFASIWKKVTGRNRHTE